MGERFSTGGGRFYEHETRGGSWWRCFGVPHPRSAGQRSERTVQSRWWERGIDASVFACERQLREEAVVVTGKAMGFLLW